MTQRGRGKGTKEGGERKSAYTPAVESACVCAHTQHEGKQIKGSENQFNWCSFEMRQRELIGTEGSWRCSFQGAASLVLKLQPGPGD